MLTDKQARALCHPTKEGGKIARPWLVNGTGNTVWTAITDGTAVLYLRGRHAYADWTGPTDDWSSCVDGASEPRVRVAWHDLAGWCREVELSETCRSCRGRGCEYCDGIGWWLAVDWCSLLKGTLDRCLLWRYLQHVYAPFVRLSSPADGRPLAVLPEDDAWRLYVMPGRLVEPGATLPRGICELLPRKAPA